MADVLVCGHTHIPYHRILPSDRHIVNAGSVGKPKAGDPRACYIQLADRDGSLEVELIRVAYKVQKAAEAIRHSEMLDEFAAMLEGGRG